ncbi:MAG: c-type cytochrome [Alphaproteobacteria bacterium]
MTRTIVRTVGGAATIACALALQACAANPASQALQPASADTLTAQQVAANSAVASVTASDAAPVTSVMNDKRLQIAVGRDIARKVCSSCHALDERPSSPNPRAPPMRDLVHIYNDDAMANNLIEGLRMAHDDQMPIFDFSVREADALLAYLKSLKPSAGVDAS